MNLEYNKVMKLLDNKETVSYPTFAYSIVNQYIPGQIHMDEWQKSALIGTNSGVFVVAGDEKNTDFHQILLDVYESRKLENKRFTLFSPSIEWDNKINMLFGTGLRQMQRYSYQFNQQTYTKAKKSKVPPEFKVKRIDAEIISKSLEFNESYIKDCWGSVSNFLENGFGYCLLHEGNIVSECISIFNSVQYVEVDITTHNDYRGLGLARNVAELFIDHCTENNRIPIWDCDVDNEASKKMAGKLGYERPIEYSIFVKKT